jgi:hypothetical protein
MVTAALLDFKIFKINEIDGRLNLLDGSLTRREFLFKTVKTLVLAADIRYFITSLVNPICTINTPGPSTSTCGEHFSAVEILLYEAKRAIKETEEEAVIFVAVSRSATQSVV